MNTRRVLKLVALATTLYGASASSQTGIDRTIDHDGRVRDYRLFVPSDLDRVQPPPLIIVLHGGGGNGEEMERRVAFNEYAQRDGWIVVYPSAVEGHWNDLRGYDGFSSHRENVDDVGLVEALITEMGVEFAIDGQRIFVTGSSNGGMMAHTIAVRLADKVAAIAPVVSLLARPVAEEFDPSRAVSVLMINDRGDPLVLWEGGDGGRANIVSMAETIGHWNQINSCRSEQTATAEAIATEADDARVSHTVWSGCAEGVNMELYAVEANKHGHPSAFLDKENGRRVYEVIWDFFNRSGRP